MITTNIISNGSKWAGQEPDSIEDLIKVLEEYTIDERFFAKYGVDRDGRYTSNEDSIYEYKNHNPINNRTLEGFYLFFGNFEEISHVFNIETNDKEVIDKLVKAIKANKGWIKYYEKNKVK